MIDWPHTNSLHGAFLKFLLLPFLETHQFTFCICWNTLEKYMTTLAFVCNISYEYE